MKFEQCGLSRWVLASQPVWTVSCSGPPVQVLKMILFVSCFQNQRSQWAVWVFRVLFSRALSVNHLFPVKQHQKWLNLSQNQNTPTEKPHLYLSYKTQERRNKVHVTRWRQWTHHACFTTRRSELKDRIVPSIVACCYFSPTFGFILIICLKYAKS